MSDNNRKYIYQICVEDNILKFNKYLIVYQGFSYEEDYELVYYVDELPYDLYIKDDLGYNELEKITTQSIYNLAEIKQKYLDLPNRNKYWYEVYCCDTNEDELKVELPKWQKIRNDNEEQRKLDEEERQKQRKIERKQYMLNQISENQNNIVNLNSKIETINDEYIKDIASKLINRLEKEIKELSSKLIQLTKE